VLVVLAVPPQMAPMVPVLFSALLAQQVVVEARLPLGLAVEATADQAVAAMVEVLAALV
jgi:hypothetical protein